MKLLKEGKISLLVLLCLISSLGIGQCKTIRVKTTGNDTNTGETWTAAKYSVKAAIDAAVAGDEVWVARGTYYEVGGITLKAGVKLYGGFKGIETSLSQRPGFPRPDPDNNASILDGNNATCVVICTSKSVNNDTTVDGFTIRNGYSSNSGGIYCVDSSPKITNNIFTLNTQQNGAIFCAGNASPIITNNIITANSNCDGAIYCNSYGTPVISENTIYSNSSNGVYCYSSKPYIVDNIIKANKTGVYLYNGSAIIERNLICNNSNNGVSDYNASTAKIYNNYLFANGGWGISISNLTAYNNTIVANKSGGVSAGSYPTSILANNIVVFNTGIGVSGNPWLRNNCVYGNTSKNYSGNPSPTDISKNPLFVDKDNGNYHLSALSPCIDAGENNYTPPYTEDIDNELRTYASRIDIGADEFWPLAVLSKQQPDNSDVTGYTACISAAFPDYFYIESDSRISGIRVEQPGHNLTAGTRVDISGTVKTNANKERYIEASAVTTRGSGDIKPIMLNNACLGGYGWNYDPANGSGQQGIPESQGLNNIGLLVTLNGKFIYTDPQTFYLNDGSGRNIKCVVPSTVNLNRDWKYLTVTGISSCELSGEIASSVLLVRKQEDILPR